MTPWGITAGNNSARRCDTTPRWTSCSIRITTSTQTCGCARLSRRTACRLLESWPCPGAVGSDLRPFRCLLDLGGGSGAYTIEMLRRYPHLQAIVFDFPAVCRIADEMMHQEGLSDRVRTVAGDYEHDTLPAGPDVVLWSETCMPAAHSAVRGCYRNCTTCCRREACCSCMTMYWMTRVQGH